LSDPELERHALESLLARPVEGLIYASIMTRKVTPPQLPRPVPTVLLNCYTDDRSLPAVVPGELAGGQAATQRLLRAGHRRIAIVNGEMWMDAAQDRFRGYRRALATADIAFDPDLVREGNWEYASGAAATRSLLALADPPTAIVFANDRMAVGGYAALAAAGLRVPRDLSVIGYDDQPICQELDPPLTSLVLPHREMGQWAIDWLLHEAARPHRGKHPIVKLDCPLVERESVGPPAAQGAARDGLGRVEPVRQIWS
jgi:LacI family transcriptional regulator